MTDGLKSKMAYAHVLPCKCVTQGPIGSKCLLDDIKTLGYPKMVMRVMTLNLHSTPVEAAQNGFEEKELILEKVTKAFPNRKGKLKKRFRQLNPNPGH